MKKTQNFRKMNIAKDCGFYKSQFEEKLITEGEATSELQMDPLFPLIKKFYDHELEFTDEELISLAKKLNYLDSSKVDLVFSMVYLQIGDYDSHFNEDIIGHIEHLKESSLQRIVMMDKPSLLKHICKHLERITPDVYHNALFAACCYHNLELAKILYSIFDIFPEELSSLFSMVCQYCPSIDIARWIASIINIPKDMISDIIYDIRPSTKDIPMLEFLIKEVSADKFYHALIVYAYSEIRPWVISLNLRDEDGRNIVEGFGYYPAHGRHDFLAEIILEQIFG